ncbi:hypothetical protein WMF27_30100 [Sorangium sp. So ce281]|uniref:hypothetical protein n=1 Tax=unclassified Sorangium TaxID=2621164 RepID=UPI003F621BFC
MTGFSSRCNGAHPTTPRPSPLNTSPAFAPAAAVLWLALPCPLQRRGALEV